MQRFGMKGPLLVSVVLAVGTTLSYGTAPWFWVMLLARMLWGIAFSVLRLSAYLVVLEESVEGTRGRMMGFYSSGMRTGSIVGVLLGGLLFDITGRTTSFAIIAAFGILGLPAAIALIRESKGTAHVVSGSQPEEQPIHHVVSNSEEAPFGGIRQKAWDFLISRAPELEPGQRPRGRIRRFQYIPHPRPGPLEARDYRCRTSSHRQCCRHTGTSHRK